MSYEIKEESPPRHKRTRVFRKCSYYARRRLSGSFACDVFKALVKQKIKIDIVANTSIGVVIAAIIAGSKSDQPEKDLRGFLA